MNIFYDQDANLDYLKGKTVAIIGYGSQGHAHAQNLRDSGVNVIVGQRPGGANYELAKEHGFAPMSAAEAAAAADITSIRPRSIAKTSNPTSSPAIPSSSLMASTSISVRSCLPRMSMCT